MGLEGQQLGLRDCHFSIHGSQLAELQAAMSEL